MALSEAKKRANAKFDAKTYSQMKLMPRKDEAEFIRKSAEARDETITGYLVNAAKLREGQPLVERKKLRTKAEVEQPIEEVME